MQEGGILFFPFAAVEDRIGSGPYVVSAEREPFLVLSVIDTTPVGPRHLPIPGWGQKTISFVCIGNHQARRAYIRLASCGTGRGAHPVGYFVHRFCVHPYQSINAGLKTGAAPKTEHGTIDHWVVVLLCRGR